MRFELRRVRVAHFPPRFPGDATAYDLLAGATDAPAQAFARLRTVPVQAHEHLEVREVDAQLVHVSAPRGWAYWSDGALTSADALAPRAALPKALSDDAEELIDRVLGSESGDPAIGWKALAAVARIVHRVVLAHVEGLDVTTFEGGVACAEALTVLRTDGTEGTLYTWHASFEAEQLYVVCDTLEALRDAIDDARGRVEAVRDPAGDA